MASVLPCQPWSVVEGSLPLADLAVVAFVQTWHGPAHYVMRLISDAASVAEASTQFFLVDADADAVKAHELGIWASPSLMFFTRGRPLRVARDEFDTCTVCIGSVSETGFETLLAQARACVA